MIVAAISLAAQTPPKFDVAVIKPVKGPVTHSRDPYIQGRTVTSVADTLRDFIEYAYRIRYERIAGGPSWLAVDHFDLEAKSDGEGALTPAEAREMLKALLAERFHLQLHRETQDAPVYELVIARNDPKFKAADADATGGCSVTSGPGGNHMRCTRGSMEGLAVQLTFSAGRTVIDKTGLNGSFAFTLDWFPGLTPPPDSELPDVFKAVQEQLGLKLVSATAPIEKLVIDRAERPEGN